MSHLDFLQTLDPGSPIPTAQTEEVHYTLPQGRANRRRLEKKKQGKAVRVLHVVGIHVVNHTTLC